MINRIQIGKAREHDAESFLRTNGLRTLKRNYRCRLGEIDLVMQDGDCLVFTEVRYRRRGQFGTGAESVTRAKQQKLLRAAAFFLKAEKISSHQFCRFDVVSVEESPPGSDQPYRMNWIQNAFQADG